MPREQLILFCGSVAGVFATACGILALFQSPLFLVGALIWSGATIICWGTAATRQEATESQPTRSHPVTEPDHHPVQPQTPSSSAPITQYEARQILDVDPDASDTEIERAYRERMKTAHPTHGGTAREVQAVHQAYQRLQPERRERQ